jgi:diguanylate cyclase (GGDEF)-like protein
MAAHADVDGGNEPQAASARPPRRGFRLLHKLSLIGALSTLPVILLATLHFSGAIAELQTAQMERRGIFYLKMAWPGFEMALRGRVPVEAYRNLFARDWDEALLLGTREQRDAVIQSSGKGAMQAAETGRDFIKRIADNAKLSVDPDVSTLNAIGILVRDIPGTALDAFDLVSDPARAGRILPAELGRFRRSYEMLSAHLGEADALNFDAALSEHLALSQMALNSAATALLDGAQDPQVDVGPLYADFIAALADFWNVAADALDGLMARRVELEKRTIGIEVLLSIGVLALACGFIVLISRSITRRLAALGTAMDHIRRGELDAGIPHSSAGDEVGEMARAVEVFRQGLIEKRATDEEIRQRNITLSRQREALRHQNVLFDTALNNMSHGLAMFDRDGGLIVCNQRFAQIYGLPQTILEPGTRQQAILSFWLEQQQHDAGPAVLEQFAAGAAGLAPDFQLELADGRTLFVSHRRMADGGWVSTHEDISERRRAEARIAHMAHFDALTLLPNRILFRQRLIDALERRGEQEQVAVLCLNIDQFKVVNDALGHSVGDALLRRVGDRLRQGLRDSSTLARLSGDEFAVVDASSRGPSEVVKLAERLIGIVAEPYTISGHPLIINACVGIALAPVDGNDGDRLLKCAELALHQAKANGPGSHHFFQAGMDERMQQRRLLELDLRAAWADRRFELHFQPIVNLGSGAVNGFEALLRWRDPKRGMVGPSEFIPLAEEIGIIAPLGEWVLREACREAARWPKHVKVAVNMSPLQFKQRDVAEMVLEVLAATGLEPSRLELEITESLFLENESATRATLHDLRRQGVRIAMDDFGIGYSALSYLRSFPFDKIKIDQSFIRDVNSPGGSMAIVRAVTQLARNLGIDTTAEGVETAEQLAVIRAEGCSEVQGYYFSKPRPAAEVPLMIRSARARSVAA